MSKNPQKLTAEEWATILNLFSIYFKPQHEKYSAVSRIKFGDKFQATIEYLEELQELSTFFKDSHELLEKLKSITEEEFDFLRRIQVQRLEKLL